LWRWVRSLRRDRLWVSRLAWLDAIMTEVSLRPLRHLRTPLASAHSNTAHGPRDKVLQERSTTPGHGSTRLAPLGGALLILAWLYLAVVVALPPPKA